MSKTSLTDAEAKAILRDWPQRPSEIFNVKGALGFWLRAQPPDGNTTGPRLVSPGANMFATQPDGLWVWLQEYLFADVIAVEVCTSIHNLNDKRSRYMPTNSALLLECDQAWLRAEIPVRKGRKTRWEACNTITNAPQTDHRIPVRHIRVLYALPNAYYDKWLNNVTPCAYEYFCKHSSLGSHTSDPFRRFLDRLAPGAQYYTRPKG